MRAIIRQGLSGAAAGALAAGTAWGAAPPASSQPSAGIYAASYYVVAESATSGSCPTAPAGSYYSGFFTYPGAAKKGATDRDFINSATGAYVQQISFPATPAAGATTWSGSYKGAYQPGNIGAVAGKFTGTLGLIDASSFVGTITYVFPFGSGDTCTIQIQGIYILSGK